ncbi:tyrosine-type recombinase/integrase [Nocardia sp. CA-107356]|uniref:tyrosine-type recombinase/integrase n=1 Tax=Nocardia sp. CA-107356 TaxID=3239972 RepID=UPI003D927383
MNRPSPWRVGVSGPLRVYVVGFRADLLERGYSERSCAEHLLRMAHLSSWLAEIGLPPEELVMPQVERFLEVRRDRSWVDRTLTVKGMQPLLDHLRGVGVVPAAEPVQRLWGGRDLVIEQFAAYLVAERGLAASTVGNYRKVAERFLGECHWEPGDPAFLSGGLVNAFVLGEASRRSRGSLNTVTTGLRALLRFLYLHAHTAALLVDAVPVAPSWRDQGVVRAVPADHVAGMLACCDRRTRVGLRDYAVLEVLARLGLRRSEVADLTVDDIGWRAGELMVTGKGNRREALPVPVDVGEAIADYCRDGRPGGGSRSLFLGSLAPWEPLSPSGVGQIVARACTRAGLPVVGAHRLRHTAATEMRAAGAPLLEIGQVLRHRNTATTMLYARDDMTALRVVARSWPGSRK